MFASSALAPVSWRQLAYMVIPDFVQKGISATRALEQYRRAGGQIRTQVWHEWYREKAGLMKMQPQIERMEPGRVVPKAWMTEADLKRPHTYRVFAEVDYTDFETGEVEKKWISFYTDELDSFSEWMTEFERQRQEFNYRTNQYITAMSFKGVVHQKGWSY